MSRDFFEKIKKMFKTSDTVPEAGRNTNFAYQKADPSFDEPAI